MKSKSLRKTFIASFGVLATMALALLLLTLPPRVRAQDYLWSTIAGKVNENGATDGKGSAARFKFPEGIAVSETGILYVADTDNHTIRKITPDGNVTTLAGTPGLAGHADGPVAVRFSSPTGLAVGTTGTIYVADRNNHVIRSVTPAGVVATVSGQPMVSGHGDSTDPVIRFSLPTGVGVDSLENLYIGDAGNFSLRRITNLGLVTTLAGDWTFIGGATVDGQGMAARFHDSDAVAVDPSGFIYVADGQGCTVRQVTSSGLVTTLAGFPQGEGSTDGLGPNARFRRPLGVAVDSNGSVYVADSDNCTIRKITPQGVMTIGGSPGDAGSADGRGRLARFNTPRAIAVDAYGVVYVADTFNKTIRKGVPLGGRTLTPRVVAVVGQPVAGDTNGATYAKLTLAQGPFGGTMKVGTKTVPAIFAGDGSVRTKVGDPAPGILGSEIASLGTPSGDAVLAKLKPGRGGVTATDDEVLLVGLTIGPASIAARRGDPVANPPAPGGGQTPVVLDKFGTIDGTGRTTFFLAKLKGGVTAQNDDALCVAYSDGIRAMFRQGERLESAFVKTIGTLVGLQGTLAEGRWRFDGDYLGARLSFVRQFTDGLFVVGPSTESFREVASLVAGGGAPPAPLNGARIKSLGFPGCGLFGMALVATLVRDGATIDATNDLAVISVATEAPELVFAQKGGIPPDGGGSILHDAFKAFGAPVSGGHGFVAFTATLTRAKGIAATGIWHGRDAATLRLLARGGDPAPGGGRFASFPSLVFPDGPTSGAIFTGTLAVSAADGVTAANKSGLWAVNTRGILIGLMRTGDQIAGVAGQTRTIKSFLALQPAPGSIGAANGYDNDGHVAALVTFTDNTVALVELTIP